MYILTKKRFNVESQKEEIQYYTGKNKYVLGECHYGLSDSIDEAKTYSTKKDAEETARVLKTLTVFPVGNDFQIIEK